MLDVISDFVVLLAVIGVGLAIAGWRYDWFNPAAPRDVVNSLAPAASTWPCLPGAEEMTEIQTTSLSAAPVCRPCIFFGGSA